jgi:hypothetical protein
LCRGEWKVTQEIGDGLGEKLDVGGIDPTSMPVLEKPTHLAEP